MGASQHWYSNEAPAYEAVGAAVIVVSVGGVVTALMLVLVAIVTGSTLGSRVVAAIQCWCGQSGLGYLVDYRGDRK